jgi:AraC family transcriptional regulator
MKHLQTGQFHGLTNTTIHLNGITLTDTEYTHDSVDWHYHENAYFTFILDGNILEGNSKEIFHCSAGTLLFHNREEPHYNIKPDGFTRGFHIEFRKSWFDNFAFEINCLQGSINISNPDIKILLYKIFKETKIDDDASAISIQGLLLQTLSQLFRSCQVQQNKTPSWVNKIKEILHDEFYKNNSLETLVKTLDIHPVHLSRYFPKYFQCSLGEYIRKLRVEKSLSLLSNRKYSLTEIAFECGFADQSHFTRCFKEINGINPSSYRKLLFA